MDSLRAAHTYLVALSTPYSGSGGNYPTLLTDLALALAAVRLCRPLQGLGIHLDSAAPPGLSPLWAAAGRIRQHAEHLIPKAESVAPMLHPEELGMLYEASLHKERITKDGLFYTPSWLATELTHQVLRPHPGTVLDPACGGGAFLLAAHAVLSAHHGARSALQFMFGVDKDSDAAAICRAALLCRVSEWRDGQDLFAAAELLAAQVRAANALFDADAILPAESTALGSHLLIRWQENFAPLASGGFDFILGNPPYGLSRGEQISAVEKSIIKRLYADWLSGKMNKYLLFMARGYELLRPGGRMGYVVPNSWLGISNATALRRKLIQDGAIEQICDFSEQLFETAGVEVVTVNIQKLAGRHSITIHRGGTPEQRTKDSFEHANPDLSGDCRISLRWSAESAATLKSLQQQSLPMGDARSPVVPRIALQAYAIGKGTPPQTAAVVKDRPFDRASKDAPHVYPYYSGSAIGRYALNWSGGYLAYGAFLAEPQELSRFMGPRIAIREILGAAPYLLHATYLEETALYNKSVLHITPKAGTSRETILALVGILNSKLASLIVGYQGKKSQRRLFPKLVNADLREFPIPLDLPQRAGELAQLVERRLAASPAEVPALEARIETTVSHLYGLCHEKGGHLSGHLKDATTALQLCILPGL